MKKILKPKKVFKKHHSPVAAAISQPGMETIYLFGVLRCFQHCTGHIMTGSWNGRGKQYIQFIRVLYCKLPTNGKQLPAFPLEAMLGTEPQPQRVGGESVTTLPPWPLTCKQVSVSIIGIYQQYLWYSIVKQPFNFHSWETLGSYKDCI